MIPLSIYPETSIWCELCDQKVDPRHLWNALGERGARLVISTQLICELAATFTSTRIDDPVARGRELFSYLSRFVAAGISCLKMNKDLLQSEARSVTGEIAAFETTLSEVDYANLTIEVQKLAQGSFDARAREFLSSRRNLCKESRNDAAAFANERPQLRLSSASASFDQFLASINPLDVVRVLIGHLRDEFRATNGTILVEVAAAMLRNPTYRVGNTMVRADLYTTWRAARAGSLARDVMDDCYHLVNACYCDAYVTKDRRHSEYAPVILGRTEVRFYDGGTPISEWLIGVASEQEVQVRATSAI
jgi:hypothetical protein